ncbi:sigma-70 family RNA polymerase sigma factor [Ornithinibacillus salinisoli]|uniref:Sigma-70 family RNA polymerase sigma factor n=1 Tax=Ornithinibacillus salinisoli TaxID=1848459 RepID=A0ABW4VY06_9BACI
MEQEIGDQEILSHSREEAISHIIDIYGESIKRLIFTYVKNYAQADDLFQEFLIKVYQNLDQFNRNSSLKTWLYRIAINKCKDYLRSPLNRLFPLHEYTKGSTMVKSAEDITLENEQQQAIVHSILALPIKYREIFVLRYYQDFTIKQVSDALGVQESTVKTRIMRGKKKLQLKLDGDYFGK